MKVQANSVSGVYLVEKFDDDCVVLDDEKLFLRCLDEPWDGDMGCEVGIETAEKIIREYGISRTPYGESLTTAAARRLGSVRSPAKSDAAKARNAARKAEGKPQGGRPSASIRAERIDSYEKMIAAGHKNPVERTAYKLEAGRVRAKVIDLLTGHEVYTCRQRYMEAADPDRARRGLETGLVSAERVWLEIDGECVSYTATLDEMREAIRRAAATK